MQSTTVKTDRELRADLKRLARRQLGAEAADGAVRRLADHWYHGPRHRSSGTETPVERWRRERVQRAASQALGKMRERCS